GGQGGVLLMPWHVEGEVARLVVGFQPLQEGAGGVVLHGYHLIILNSRRLGRRRGPQVGPGAWGGGGTTYPAGGRGFSEASGRSAPLPRLPGGGPHFSREMGRK